MNKIAITVGMVGIALAVSGCNGFTPIPETEMPVAHGDNVKKAVVILIEKVKKIEDSTIEKVPTSKAHINNDEVSLLKNMVSAQNEQIKNQSKEISTIKEKIEEVSKRNTTIVNTDVIAVEPSQYDKVIKDFANVELKK